MKKNEAKGKALVMVLLALLALPGLAMAQGTTIAEVENLGDTLVWHPFVQFKALRLTVTGPCNFVYEQTVTKGEPVFRLDQTTIDGVYRYDLVRIEDIDPGTIEILQQARKNDDTETVNQLCRDGRLPAPPLNQSAGFHVFEGRIVYDPGSVEKVGRVTPDIDALVAEVGETPVSKDPAAEGTRVPLKDFVINDDLIVDGSACIGFDCVNGESFGFDTIRLKENNLRIKFDDTSTAASFPRNDWQITANDSANGGASKFSIDDISGSRTPFTIEANARSHSLYVDDGGRIGSRTSTPSVEIHTIDGDTPTLRLQQDGSSGFAPQTWDVAGNETNFFVRDVTNGSTLPLRIRPGAPSSAIFIDVSGDVGMGTSSPDEDFELERTSGNVAAQVKTGTAAVARVRVTNSLTSWDFRNTGGGDFAISLDGSGVNEVLIDDATGNVTIENDLTVNGTIFGTVSSSRALKTAIEPIDARQVLAKVREMPVASWNYNLGTPVDNERHLGPMAEDFHAAFGLGRDEHSISLVDYSGVAFAAIQGLALELQDEVEVLKAQNAALMERLANLEKQLTASE